MKVFVTSVLAVLVLLSLLAARLVPSEVDRRKVQLIWVSDLNPARKEQIAQFNEMYPQYQLHLDANNNNAQKIIMQAAAGAGPAVFDSWGPAGLQLYVRAGIAADVTELAREMGFEYTKSYPGIWSSFVYNGRQYGFPCNAQANVIYVNKTVFRRYGVPLPTNPRWTWAQFIDTARKVTARRPDGRGCECYGFGGTWNMEIIMQHGGRYFSPDGTRCVLDSPQAIAGQTLYFDLMFTHHVTPTPIEAQSMSGEGGWGQGAMNVFANGRYAMMRGGRYMLIRFRNYYTVGPGEKREPLELAAMPLPRAPGREPLAVGGARCALVNADCPNLRDACAFLQYLSTDRYNRELNRSADDLPPVAAFADGEEFLRNPSYPQEDFHDVFRQSIRTTVSVDISPFIDASDSGRILTYEFEQSMDRLGKSARPDTARAAREMLTNAAMKINEKIQQNIARNNALRKEYEQALAGSAAKGASPAP